MKRIIIYINSMNASGGIERVIANLMFFWTKKYEIILLTKDKKESFYKLPENIDIQSINVPLSLNMNNRLQRIIAVLKNFIKTLRVLKKKIKEINPDFIYTTNPMNSLEVLLTMKNCNRKLVISEHGSFYGYNKIYTEIKRIVYPRAYKVSVLNKMDTDIYNSWGKNAVYIPHLVTFEAKEKNLLNSKIVLNVGRLTDDKQQMLLLEMWSKVLDKNGWKLWIVGDGELKNELKAKVCKLNLSNSVRIIPATTEIEKIYKQASCFAFTSKFEGFGMVLLEAMSFGIPCISFDCPSGPRDIIVNEKNGFLIKNNDRDMYIEKLKQITKMQSDELCKMGEDAFKTVKAWDNDKIIKLWDKVFEEIRV